MIGEEIKMSTTDFPMLKGSLLIVEDNKTTQTVLMQMATLIGIEAEAVDDGIEALQQLSEKKYDIIIMDSEMPRLNGFETTKKIRSRNDLNQNIPIISITGTLSKESHAKCLAVGMNDFLAKPFSMSDLHRTISRWLRSTENYVNNTGVEQNEFPAKQQSTADLQRLEKLAGRSPEAFRRFIEMFLRDTSDAFESLNKSLTEGSIEDAAHFAHSCAGASSFCGFTMLTDLLRNLENSIKEDDLTTAKSDYQKAFDEFLIIKNQLSIIK